MTEVLISENNINPRIRWYQIRALIKSEELYPKPVELDDKQNRNKQSKSLWIKIKAKLFKKLNEGSNIKPVLSITEKKDRVFVEIGRTNGNIFSHFPMK